MKKKGFTLIELITTFALTATIVIILMNVILIIKNIYSMSNLKTNLLIKQSELSNILNSKINNGNLISYEACNDSQFCYEFSFLDGSNIKLNVVNNKITFGNYVYKLDETSTIESPLIEKKENLDITDTTVNDSFLIIKIPIKSSQYPNDNFGINLVYQYNSNNTSL